MVIRSTALDSALAGMNGAFDQLAATAQNLAKPIITPPEERAADSESSGIQSMSEDIGDSLISLNESLTQARRNSATARTAQEMFDELLEIGRR